MVNRDKIYKRHFSAVKDYLAAAHGINVANDLNVRNPNLKVYMSRSRLPSSSRKIVDEDQLEEFLSHQGWVIVHPQELSLQHQIVVWESAAVVMGALGSAFHLLMALGLHVDSLVVITLGFPDELDRPGPGMNFGLQFKKQAINYHHLPFLEPAEQVDEIELISRSADLKFNLSFDDLLAAVNNIAFPNQRL